MRCGCQCREVVSEIETLARMEEVETTKSGTRLSMQLGLYLVVAVWVGGLCGRLQVLVVLL